MKSLSLIESTKTSYTLELDDGLCKSFQGNVGLPKELTSYHNKSVSLPHKQQLAAYHLLLDYAAFSADEKQREVISMVKEFSNIYEHSLEEANPEKDERAKFYFYDEVIVNIKVFQKAQRDYDKKNPKPIVEVLYKREEENSSSSNDALESLKKDQKNKLAKKRNIMGNDSNPSIGSVPSFNISIEAPQENDNVKVSIKEELKIHEMKKPESIEITVE